MTTPGIPLSQVLDANLPETPGGLRAHIDLVADVMERSGESLSAWESINGWHDIWEDDREVFERVFPHGPQEMLDLLSDGHGNALYMEFEMNEDCLEMRVAGSGSGSGIYSLEREFDFEDQTVYLKKLYLHDSAQGAGKGMRILMGTYEVCKRLGFRAMNLHAYEVGNYVWAKAGFICYTWHAVRKEIARAGADIIAGLPADIKKEVEAILADGNDKAIWKLADLEHEVATPDGPRKLGKALLLKNKSWHGTFKLDDAECVARLKAYAKSRGIDA